MIHRYLNNEELKKIDIEKNYINGNINRMCVSDDCEELYYNCKVAINRILYICSVVENKFDEF